MEVDWYALSLDGWNKKATVNAVAFRIWRPYGDSNPVYRRERAMS